jgi:hypothetical protein
MKIRLIDLASIFPNVKKQKQFEIRPSVPSGGQWQASLCSGQCKDTVNWKVQQEHGNHQQSKPHTTSLETLADRYQQQDGCQRHG